MEHRMRCKVCGKIWCFTDKDLIDSKTNSLMGGLAAIGTIASAFGGTTAQQHLNYDMMERNEAKTVDYHQCPNCRSKDVIELSEDEWEEAQVQKSFANTRVSINANATTEALLNRIKLLLEDKDWANANAYCDAVLDAEPENSLAYVYKLMAELCVSTLDELGEKKPFDKRSSYQRALRFADESTALILQKQLDRSYNHANEQKYENAHTLMGTNYQKAAELFDEISDYKDAGLLRDRCLREVEKAAEEKAKRKKKRKTVAIIFIAIAVIAIVSVVCIQSARSVELSRQRNYNKAISYMEDERFENALAIFEELGNYKDCQEQIMEVRYRQALTQIYAGEYDEAIAAFEELGDYKDSKSLIELCNAEKADMDGMTALADFYEDCKSIGTDDGVITVRYDVNDQKVYVEYWFDKLLQVNNIPDNDSDYIEGLKNDQISSFKDYIQSIKGWFAERTYETTAPVVVVMYASTSKDVVLWQTEI